MEFVVKLILIFVASLAVLLSSPVFGNQSIHRDVSFPSAVYSPTPFQIRRAKALGRTASPTSGQELRGRLSKPKGKGPFGAFVLMHGCNGIGQWNKVWTARLLSWGYVVLNVDSLEPRGHSSICGRGTVVAGPTRGLDAYGAASFLRSLPFVATNRIAILGMSHGGWSALNAINRSTTNRLRTLPFRAAIALYPWCAGPTKLDAPLLILAAELDDWTPVHRCRAFVKSAKTPHHLELKVYKGAHHMFDVPGVNTKQLGHILRHDPKAEKNAVRLVKKFIEDQM